jgi:6-phosphogluconolactonase (cycloisomerase 2 family)
MRERQGIAVALGRRVELSADGGLLRCVSELGDGGVNGHVRGINGQEIGQNTAEQLDWSVAEPHYYYSFDCESKREHKKRMRAFIRTLSVFALILAPAAILGCGSSTPPNKTIAFLYAVEQGANSIFNFKQLSDGQVQSASVFTTATVPRPVALALTPSKNFLYVANLTSNVVSGFSIDHTTGVLAPVGNAIPPTSISPAQQPIALGVSSGSQFLYVLSQGTTTVDPTISIFSIDARGLLTGAGSIVAGSATTGNIPTTLVVSPTAGVLYIASGVGTATTISGFQIAANGSLAPIGGGFTGPAGTNFAGLTIDSKGQFLYAPDSGNNKVFSFSIGASGALTPVAGSPFSTGKQPVSVAVDANNAFLYTANKGSDDISGFTVKDGVLTQITGSPFPSIAGSTTPVQPDFITIDPSNFFVYVGNAGSINMSGFAINLADGTLVGVSNSPFGGVGATSIVVTK